MISVEEKKEIPRLKRVTYLIASPSEERKKLIEVAVNEVIDVLRKKHQLDIPECAYALNVLVEGFEASV